MTTITEVRMRVQPQIIRRLGILALTCGTGFLGGCFLVPGMQMDAVAQNSAPRAPEADIYPIDGPTIQRLADESIGRRAVYEVLSSKPPRYEYTVGAQDVLRVTVWDHPELNNPGAIAVTQSAPVASISTSTGNFLGQAVGTDSTSRIVNDDGTMFYPYVGLINVEGKTVEQISLFLTNALRKTIREPQVEVVVAQYRSKRVYVTGNVKSPGAVPISDVPVRVADAVTAAGGATSDADLSDVMISRNGAQLPVDLYKLLYQGSMAENLQLLPNDVINIPEQRFNKVFVLGEVTKPASLLMPRGTYSLNEALADSGGVSQITAQASQVYVIRGTPSRPQIYHLNAASPDALVMADQFLLQPRDIIFVDAAPVVRASRVISQILPSLQALQAGKYLSQ